MKTMDISEARRLFTRLGGVVKENKWIWVLRHGKKAFAIVDPEVMEAFIETIGILSCSVSAHQLADAITEVRESRGAA